MPTFTYTAESVTFVTRPMPRHPGVWEHMFYSRAEDLPELVPHGCNPRDQNINMRVYQKVAESFSDVEDTAFHIKNKGITVLATGVARKQVGEKVILTVDIPDELGNVDGQHTHEIVTKYKAGNPDQLVGVRIIEKLPPVLISPVAAGLNTSVQVTNATMADHYGLFDTVQEVLKSYEYASWIGYRQNAQEVSANSKDLVSLMWVCNPSIFEDNTAWHPSWVFSRSAKVYDRFYNEKELAFREKLLTMTYVLPDLIDMYRYINENVSDHFKSRRKKRTADADVNDNKEYEIGVEDLCGTSIGLPFRDPANRGKYQQLKECYRLILISGLRSLLTLNSETGYVEWVVDYELVTEILDKALKKIYQQLVRQLRTNKRDHNSTSRQPAVWDLPASTIKLIYLQEYSNRKRTNQSRPPHSLPAMSFPGGIDIADPHAA